jgi:uncharacterized protein (DUF305 family)
MNILTSTAVATAATLAFIGIAHVQDAAAQGHGMGAATMPEACMAGATGMPGHGMMDAPAANMSEHQAAMMQGMMATSDQMMQGVMAEDPDLAFACGMIPHHQAAINMAEAELKFGDDPEMRAMAQGIIDAQTAEIEQLATWIEEHVQ